MVSRDLVHRFPFYYGWVILAAATLGFVMTGAGQTFAVSMFIEHLIRDLNLTRSEVSGLYTAATLLASLGLSTAGRLIDRQGCRRSVVWISLALGASCVFLSFVQNGVMLLLGFTLIRFWGPGALGLVSNNVINQWWIGRRGRVMGFSGMVTAIFGFGLFPFLLHRLIGLSDWRTAFLVIGFGVWLVCLPVGGVFFRERPENYGLRPDNSDMHQDEQAPLAEPDWSHREAIRTRTFWLVAAGLSTHAMMITGLHFHIVGLFEAGGQKPGLAAQMYLPMGLVTATLCLVGGFLKERLPVRTLLTFSLALLGFTMLLGKNLDTFWVIAMYGLALGTNSGLFQVIFGVVWADLFGRRQLGAITGTASSLIVAGSALGPLPLAWAQAWLGDYDRALEVLCLLPFGLSLLTLTLLKKPFRPISVP